MEDEPGAGWLGLCTFSTQKSLLTTAVEFPAENASVRMQAHAQTHFLQACQSIYRQEGIAGFYRGWGPAYCRTFAKNLYQWSLIQGLQNQPSLTQLNEIDPSKNLKNCAIAVAVACVDTTVLAPVEKMKVQTILNLVPTPTGADLALAANYPNEPSSRTTSPQRLLKKWLRSNPYQGCSPFYAEQLLGWSLFLVGQNEGRRLANHYFGEKHEATYLPVLGLILGSLETALVLPFANIRTKMIVEQQNWNGPELRDAMQKMGTQGLYYGWKPALLRSVIAGVCDVAFMAYYVDAHKPKPQSAIEELR